MAKHIIRYLLEGDGAIPLFVENGGYFVQGQELVGVSVDDSKRHLPTSVHKLTRAELVARILLNHKKVNGDPVTSEEAEEIASNFLSANGMSDY